MFNHFFKYQSLGNDFIVFDWYKKPSQYLDKDLSDAAWPEVVQRLCNRHFGIGADGVLIVKNNQQAGVPEMLIFNSDGSLAKSCLNGVRCIALHMRLVYNYPENFSIKLADRLIESIFFNGHEGLLISTGVGTAQYHGVQTIHTNAGTFAGHIVDVGNPHFIIFQFMPQDWLAQNGHFIERHEFFSDRTNVEFIWPDNADKNIYHMNVYERGCGVTLACSSGAAALAGLLVQLGTIAPTESITISMPGGIVKATVNMRGEIFLQAPAQRLFEGTLPTSMLKMIPEWQAKGVWSR